MKYEKGFEETMKWLETVKGLLLSDREKSLAFYAYQQGFNAGIKEEV